MPSILKNTISPLNSTSASAAAHLSQWTLSTFTNVDLARLLDIADVLQMKSSIAATVR